MIQLRNIIVLLMTLFLSCQGHIFRSPWQFSADFVEQRQPPTKHEDAHQNSLWTTSEQLTEQLCENKPANHSWITAENAHKIINIATVLYACITIYNRYQQIDAVNKNDYILITKIKQIMHYMCPQFIQTIGTHGVFFVDSLEIICKALLYKTVAQLIVLCGSGNIFDLIGHGLQKAANLVV